MLTQTPAVEELSPSSIYAQVEKEFACQHDEESVALTRFTKINGTVEYRYQCLSCGESVKVVKKDTVPASEREALPEFDRSIVSRRREAWRARYDELRQAQAEAERDEWQERYQAHLRSPKWARLRQMVLERERGLCQGCRNARAIEVHHLTYAHVGNEFLFELVALCPECHRGVHGRGE